MDQITRDWSKSSSSRITLASEKEKASPRQADSFRLLRRESPNLIWPANHTWLVASEIDFDSTLVGGSAKLIEAIIECSELEAWHVWPTDSLAADADKINGLRKTDR